MEREAERLVMALELAELAERMLRQKLRRTQPEASEEEIERQVDAWYAKRPGAEHGDAEGPPLPWPRG